MTSPTLRRNGAYYLPSRPDLGALPSVTAALSATDGSGTDGLIGWAARLAREAALDTHDRWHGLNRNAALNVIEAETDARRSLGRDVGDEVHEAAHAAVLGTLVLAEVPERSRPYVQQFLRFLDEYAPEVIAWEETVASIRFRYAGTPDGIVRLRGAGHIADIKTGKSLYSAKMSRQLAAYRFADVILRGPHECQGCLFLEEGHTCTAWVEEPMPQIEGGLIVHLKPTSYALIPVECGEAVLDEFLKCLDLYEARNERRIRAALRPRREPIT